MIFCEDCRIKNGWPRAAGFPYAGISENANCEICKRIGIHHDVPGSMLTPNSQKTFEEKTVSKIMEEAFQDKAENLVVTHLSGRLDHEKTDLLKKIFVKNNGVVDWYWTYKLRVVAQQGYRRDEESKRNRATGEL